MSVFSSLLFGLSLLSTFCLGEDDTRSPANIILIMVDDIGRSDIGAFGAEWDTPNIDSFISDSVTLSHHYIGYVCSASRSQFLTGRYSYHMGYGELDVFDLGKTAGYIPRGAPTIAEYLKHFSNYETYAIGKWQLGSSTDSQIAVGRGFDAFWGFNGGMEEYNSKIRDWTGDESDDSYFDFYTNDEPTSEASGEYSTDQYYSKALSWIETHYSNEETQDKPFFMYLALQAIHGPFTESILEDYETEYHAYCDENYGDSFLNWENRKDVCGAMIGIDTQFGTFLDAFSDNEILSNNNVWENTLIVLTSDNGGSLDKGSCNYPLRGGKNTFHEGGQRVLAIAGGGIIPDEQRGSVLDGLVSNVDWAPTFLSFANLIPSDYTHIKLGDADDELPMVLDGYNLYSYIMGENEKWVRDHLIFHMKPNLEFTLEWEFDDISDYNMKDMEEFALIFYDKSGNLWKYLDVDISSNIIGDPITNAGFCEAKSDNVYYHTDTTEDDVVYNGVFNLNNDKREKNNFETLIKTGDGKNLEKILKEKLNYYVNSKGDGSQSSTFLYGHFSCLLHKTDDIDEACFNAAKEANAWVTFQTDDEAADSIKAVCDVISEEHTIYKLMTTPFEFPDIDENSDGQEEFLNYITDNTATIKKLNHLAPKKHKRTFEKGMILDLEKVWDQGEYMTPIEAFDDVDENEDEINVDDIEQEEQEDADQELEDVDVDEEEEEQLNLNSITQYGKHVINHFSVTSIGIIIVSLIFITFYIAKKFKNDDSQKYQSIP